MFYYLFIGMLFTMFVEMIMVKSSGVTLTMGERLLTIAVWPLMLIYMIYEMLK
jgi:hypothetical protein